MGTVQWEKGDAEGEGPGTIRDCGGSGSSRGSRMHLPERPEIAHTWPLEMPRVR